LHRRDYAVGFVDRTPGPVHPVPAGALPAARDGRSPQVWPDSSFVSVNGVSLILNDIIVLLVIDCLLKTIKGGMVTKTLIIE